MNLVCLTLTGPRGRSWNLTPIDLDAPESDLIVKIDKSIRSNAGVMSIDFGWDFDPETMVGSIWVGPGRTVGTISGERIGAVAS